MKRNPKCIPFATHHYPVRIFFVPTRADWDAVMRDVGIAGESYAQQGGQVTSATCEGHEDRIFICFGDQCDKSTWEEVVGVMAHECVHVLQNVEESINGKLGDEPQAYFVQSLLLWLIAEYRKAGRGWRDGE